MNALVAFLACLCWAFVSADRVKESGATDDDYGDSRTTFSSSSVQVTDKELRARYPEFASVVLNGYDGQVSAKEVDPQIFNKIFSKRLGTGVPDGHEVLRAWKIDNQKLLRAYDMSRSSIRRQLQERLPPGQHPFFLKDAKAWAEWQGSETSEGGVPKTIAGNETLEGDVGEHVFFHGTVPKDKVLLSIMRDGLQVRGETSLLGAAVYLAGPEEAYKYSECDDATKWRFTLVLRAALGFPVVVKDFGDVRRWDRNDQFEVNDVATYGEELPKEYCCEHFSTCSSCTSHGCAFCEAGALSGRLFSTPKKCRPLDTTLKQACKGAWLLPSNATCPHTDSLPPDLVTDSNDQKSSKSDPLFEGRPNRDKKTGFLIGQLNSEELALRRLKCFELLPQSVISKDIYSENLHYLFYEPTQVYIDYVIMHVDNMPAGSHSMHYPDSFRKCS